MKKRFFALFTAICVLMILSIAALTETANGLKPLWEANDTRNKIAVISDIHLGIDDSFAENVANKEYLLQFLKRLQATADVRELVIAGDFLDEWYLPLNYPAYSDSAEFYRKVIANNQNVMDALKGVMSAGIKLVYVPGNHDMLLESGILDEALPGIVQARDVRGLGAYYTGDRNEIVIEHGHRYDVFSAPDTLSNAALCGNGDTILPAGYFYARYATSWVIEGRPSVKKDLPVVSIVPEKTDTDQYGAYIYHSLLKNISARMTPNESLDQKIFDVRIAGFNDAYTYLDFYPAQQEDGTISAPVLFKNIQRTWAERQTLNHIKVPNSFLEAVSGTLDWEYYFKQAKAQYLENPNENVDVVVFGHTHVPTYRDIGSGKYYINDGTWIDHNTDYPDATRTFTVITTGDKDTAVLFKFMEDGSVNNISVSAGKAEDKNAAAGETSSAANALGNVTFDVKAVENYGDDATQARYVEVSGLTDNSIQAKLNEALKTFCLQPTMDAASDTTYDIMPVFEVVSGDLLSIRTYNTAYTAGAAYPVNSIRTQLFSLAAGDTYAGDLWDFIKDKDAFKQLALDGKFGLKIAGAEGEIPEEIKAAAYQKLAEGMDTSEFATQFFFGDGGSLNVWCDGDNHATGDYWLFDMPVIDLEGIATDKLIPIIETLKNLGK